MSARSGIVSYGQIIQSRYIDVHETISIYNYKIKFSGYLSGEYGIFEEYIMGNFFVFKCNEWGKPHEPYYAVGIHKTGKIAHVVFYEHKGKTYSASKDYVFYKGSSPELVAIDMEAQRKANDR
jgi:hypothetical protein